ncbi:TetR/AcrR family transcriptional regulator [Cytobacillus sp. FSL R5-0569]|uniref:TetR/AcrR family transcriptional regulator n=1 Tax=Cytobacillus sp. FSL R5-0569 TaxID=2921649 RepID=UPI0030FBCE42
MKNQILKKSIDLFDDKGFKETTIQDIVDQLDVTKGTFYYYFNSKQEVLRDIHLEYIEGLLQEQEEILQNQTLSNKEKLYENIYLTLSKIDTQGKEARIVHRELRHLHEDHVTQIKLKRKEYRLNFEKIIDEGKKTREFSNHIRTDILAFGFLGMTNYSYYWFRTDGELTDKELARFYTEIILKGIEEVPVKEGI